jgi:hypothetical protein
VGEEFWWSHESNILKFAIKEILTIIILYLIIYMEKFITYDGHTVEDFNVYIANARIVQTKHLCSELLALYNNPEFPHKSDFKAVLDTII